MEKRSKVLKRIFVTHILPRHLIEKHSLSTAACNFSFNLMSGGAFDDTFSILGTYVGGQIEPEAFTDHRFKLFYNTFFRTKGRFCIQIASILEQCEMFCKIPKNSVVWLYNVTTLNAFFFFLLRLFKRSVQINVIELDFTPVEKSFGLNQVFLWIINHCHGNIRLAYSSLFKNPNSVTLPGIVPQNCGEEPLLETLHNNFLLSGVLQEHISQLSMVLKCFAGLPHCTLHITGKVDNEEMIASYAAEYENIKWYGNLSYEDYLNIMHSCTFQLSMRDPNYPENQCNFPSKIIEALLHNRIIISTIQYKQLDGIKYFVAESKEDSFKNQIDIISRMPTNTLKEYANQGNKVAEKFGTHVWNNAIRYIEKYGNS